MPRRGRGGRRQGVPGKAYTNRSDLNQSRIAEFQGQTYGTRADQVESQRAVPIAQPPMPGPAAAPTPAAAGPDPGTLGGLLDPTARPAEPVTAGIASGPGPGPGGLNLAGGDPDADNLRAIYRAYPSTALLRLIATLEEDG